MSKRLDGPRGVVTTQRMTSDGPVKTTLTIFLLKVTVWSRNESPSVPPVNEIREDLVTESGDLLRPVRLSVTGSGFAGPRG